MIREIRGKRPQIDPTAFVAETAVVIGDAILGPHASVWFGAVVRADNDQIVIGEGTNIQDGAIVHADPGEPVHIGKRVTLGHQAIVHAATLEDDVLIGIGAVVLNGAVIGEGSLVGSRALVTAGTKVPPRSLVLGVPGKVVGSVDDERFAIIQTTAAHYLHHQEVYKKSYR
ncbi:MAG: gamma carbonic anhydrase family protein [Chloroflexi bacterium]|nr:gamma carbonic anhydrase family protein [Chloroflexota bacterium]